MWKDDFLEAHNQIRRQHKLPLFQWSDPLMNEAQAHVDEMQRTNRFFHKEISSTYSMKSLQNIAMGKKNLIEKVTKPVELWMTDNHKLPILDPSKTLLGAAYNRNPKDNTTYISCNYA